MKKALLTLFACGAVGCSSTRLVYSEKFDRTQKPVYEDYMDYYFLGFVGHPSVNVQKVCMDQKPLALQRIFTFDDALISLVTIGIYTPWTVRVWCGD